MTILAVQQVDLDNAFPLAEHVLRGQPANPPNTRPSINIQNHMGSPSKNPPGRPQRGLSLEAPPCRGACPGGSSLPSIPPNSCAMPPRKAWSTAVPPRSAASKPCFDDPWAPANSRPRTGMAPPMSSSSPLDFMARLAALIPKLRVNLTRYHGVFAPPGAYLRQPLLGPHCSGFQGAILYGVYGVSWPQWLIYALRCRIAPTSLGGARTGYLHR